MRRVSPAPTPPLASADAACGEPLKKKAVQLLPRASVCGLVALVANALYVHPLCSLASGLRSPATARRPSACLASPLRQRRRARFSASACSRRADLRAAEDVPRAASSAPPPAPPRRASAPPRHLRVEPPPPSTCRSRSARVACRLPRVPASAERHHASPTGVVGCWAAPAPHGAAEAGAHTLAPPAPAQEEII
ncbi:Protein of unknown function [Gryllus bimaculatus]|nr:Protein of unknown function [Gryllus bimaculatus]